jgi:hypothetical protein
LLTSVIVEEINSHIVKEARRVAEQLKTAATNALVRGCDADLTAKLSHGSFAKKIADAGFARLQTFLKHSRAEIIPVDAVAVTPILADYFASQPPFGVGKKKSEFPDAFTLHALRAWAEGKKYTVVVVSGDADLKAFCDANPPLQLTATLATFLAIFPDVEASRAIMKWMDDQWDAVQEIVGDQLEKFSFDLKDVDGTVNAVRLVSMQVLDSAVVEISNGAARVAADVEVEFEADIYAYPRHWHPRDEMDYPSKESGSVIDYMQMSLDIAVTLDSAGTVPVEIDRVEIVDRPMWPRVRVPDDWDRGRRHY